MLKILALTCAMTLAPSECDLKTARLVVELGRARTPQQCGFLGQATLATSSLAPRRSAYVKYVCAPLEARS